MPQTCTVCAHPRTKQIENDIVQGLANTKIADKFGLDHQSVRYHSIHHLPEKLVQAVQQEHASHAEDILSGIRDLLTRTKTILDKAEEQGHNRLALEAIKEARSSYELLSKIAVKLEEYRRKDEEREEVGINDQVMEGLEALSTAELKTYIALQSKIYAASEQHQLEPGARYMVESMASELNDGMKKLKEVESRRSKVVESRQSTDSQDKNTQNKRVANSPDQPDSEFEDIDDFDLELDDLQLRDSEPKWLEKWRKKNHLV